MEKGDMSRKRPDEKAPKLDEVESGVVELFAGMVRMLGLPPSIGSIYGLLFISPAPLCLDDIVGKLGISKGSASQGLGVLRKLGALRPVDSSGRREFFAADLELKKLVGGFLRTEVLPQLDRGVGIVEGLRAETTGETGASPFRRDRLGKLANWQRRSRQVLGLLHRFLD